MEVNTGQKVSQISTSDSCQQAWRMTDAFVSMCSGLYSQHIVAIMLTGSLTSGSYQPGLSDVDLITVLDDDCPDTIRTDVSRLYQQVGHDYSIQFDPLIVSYRDFWPPWDSNPGILQGILRLKANGKVLFGKNIIAELPTPTKKEVWQSDRLFREWLAKSEQPHWQDWTLKSSLKTILGEASSYFYYRTGIAEYSKHHIAKLFSHHIPHFGHLSTLELASYLWRNYPDSVDEELRSYMAEQAKNCRNHVTLELGFGEKCLIQ